MLPRIVAVLQWCVYGNLEPVPDFVSQMPMVLFGAAYISVLVKATRVVDWPPCFLSHQLSALFNFSTADCRNVNKLTELLPVSQGTDRSPTWLFYTHSQDAKSTAKVNVRLPMLCIINRALNTVDRENFIELNFRSSFDPQNFITVDGYSTQ